MLYATTRDNRDAYTPYRVLRENRGPKGGLFVPFHLPRLSQSDIEALYQKSFGACVSDILNLFFSTKIGPEVEFAIGRNPVRLNQLGQRITLCECWHNPSWDFSRMADSLSGLLLENTEEKIHASEWMSIAVRIAVYFGILGELYRLGVTEYGTTVDISVVSGDFSAPMAAWYARAMGLPIGKIICCCNENHAVWELFRNGTMKTDGIATQTALPEADIVIPLGLERLVCAAGGCSESERFAGICSSGKIYRASDRLLKELQRGLHVTVSSQARIGETVANYYKSKAVVLSPYAALACSGVQDYRSMTGEWKHTLVLSDRSPMLDIGFIASVLHIPENIIQEYF